MKSAFKEKQDGKVSSTRIIAVGLTTLYVIIAIIVFITQHRLVDIPTNLMILITGLYGINKVGSAVSSFSQKFNER